MKVRFCLDFICYIAPSKRDAKRFLKFWGCDSEIIPLNVSWKITHIERAPQWGQMRKLNLPGIEYG